LLQLKNQDFEVLVAGLLKDRKWAVKSLFGEKCRLDNAAGIRYLNTGCRLPHYGCCLIFGSNAYWDASGYVTQF
jgi:hypothetical protein